MEVFSILVEKASARGFLSGHKFVGRSEETLQISHLLFADDTRVLQRLRRSTFFPLLDFIVVRSFFWVENKLGEECHYASRASGKCRPASP